MNKCIILYLSLYQRLLFDLLKEGVTKTGVTATVMGVTTYY